MAPRARRLLAFLIALALLIPGAARAGPWPREPGQTFLSATANLSPDSVLFLSEFYAEFGLTPHLTIGGAVQVSTRLDHYELFARWHPATPPAGLALGLMSGLRYVPDSSAPLQPFLGVEIGRGTETPLGNIWMQAGVRIFAAQASSGIEYATDWTSQVGLRRGRWIGMIGLTHYRTRFNALTRLRPAVGVRLGHLTLVAEAVIPPDGQLESVRLGLWSEF